MRAFTLALLLAAAGCATAHAAVTDAAAGGFEVVESAVVAAAPQAVYATLLDPGRWWASEHTFSGDAHNLTLNAAAGGCWCEALPDGGSVEHMRVVMAAPAKRLVLKGGLGPFMNQAMGGAMEWSLKPAGDTTMLTLTYRVAGYMRGGFAAFPAAVDGVLAQQVARLKQEAEKNPAAR